MPWSMAMAMWLFDPVATAVTGRTQFKLPYPGGDWDRERQMNEPLLEHMKTAARVAALFAKDAEKWNEEDDRLYMWLYDEDN